MSARLSAAEVAALTAAPDALRLHLGPRGEVWRVTWAGRPAALKLDRAPGLRSRWGERLRGSRAARAQSAARALRALGFAAPEPLGLCEEGEGSASLASFVEGPTLSAALAAASPSEARGLALAAARLCARLHLAGVRCRDLKPPNLIVQAGEPLTPTRTPTLTLIDLEDVRVCARVPLRWRRRNLAALDAYAQLGPRPLGVGVRLAALRAYAALTGEDPRALLGALLPAARVKARALRVRLAGPAAGGDPVAMSGEP